MKTDFNGQIDNRARLAIAGGALTNSKRPETFVKGVYPTHVSHGNGCYLYTKTNKKLVDYICALGTNLFGYSNPFINRAVIDQLHSGSVFSLGSHLEIAVAERLKETFLWPDRVRFLKTGTEACMAAVRIARGHNPERKLLLSDGYHGWNDEFVSLTPPAVGIVGKFEVKLLSDNMDKIKEAAAVIIEPVQLDWSEERVQYLRALRDECSRHNTVLIFDEIITGFRVPKKSFSGYFGVRPDILLLGKAMGAGLPLSAILGKKEVMEGSDYFVSSTFAGDCLALAACQRAIDLLSSDYDINSLWLEGERFLEGVNKIWPGLITGYPTRGAFVRDEKTWLLWQECVKAGILFGPSFFLSFAHDRHVLDFTLSAIDAIKTKIDQGTIKLEGEAPQSPFANRSRK